MLFRSYYLEKFGQPYYWQAKDAGGMKQLLDKIKFSRGSKQTPLPVDDDSLLSALPLFLNSVNDPWLLEHFSVPILNSKYNEIVTNASKTRKQNASTGMILTDNSTDKYDTEEERKLRARFS